MDVSIIIPCNVNRGFLNEAIKSAQKQIFNGKFEVIVKRNNLNLSTNANLGISEAKGKYIKLLSEDDTLPVNSIQLLFNFMEKNKLVWCASNATVVNATNGNRSLQKSYVNTFKDFVSANTIHGGTTMYRRDALIAIKGFDVALDTAEEYELHLRLWAAGYVPGILNATTYNYYRHQLSKSLIYRSTPELLAKKKIIMETIKGKYR